MLYLGRREDVSQELRSPGCGGLLIRNASIGRIDYYGRISFSDPVLNHVVGRISSILDAVRCPTASLIQCPCMSGWPSTRRVGFQRGGAVVCPIAGPGTVHAISMTAPVTEPRARKFMRRLLSRASATHAEVPDGVYDCFEFR